MASINKVILIGNLGADQEMRTMPGDAVVTFVWQRQNHWKDKATGEKKELTGMAPCCVLSLPKLAGSSASI